MSSRYIAVKELTESVWLGITRINKDRAEVEVEYCSRKQDGAFSQITLPSKARLKRNVNTNELVFSMVGSIHKIKEFKKVGEGA